METTSQLLGGLGALGMIGALLLGCLLFFILPWWAIIECVQSNRPSDSKTILVVVLILTWGLGSLIYGLFGTRSRALRRFTIFTFLGPLVLLLPSVISFMTGATLNSQVQQEKREKEEKVLQARAAEFQPLEIAPSAVAPFQAIQFVHGKHHPEAATLARFTLLGPQADGARNIDKSIRHIAHDSANERTFALTTHDFGTITPSSGRFTKIEVDPSLGNFSWPKGLALNTRDGTVIIMTSHVSTRFYTYDPKTSDWKRLPTEFRDRPLRSLTYSAAENSLYALEEDSQARTLERIHRLNTTGARLGVIQVEPPIPLSSRREFLPQLHFSSDKLILMLPPLTSNDINNRILAVDPNTGTVHGASR